MPSSPPTALLSWAHAANEGVSDEEWLNEVLQLAVNLRHFGVDADLDLFHLSEAGVDWNKWGPGRIRSCDFTLVVVNHAWTERFEGTNSPTVGAGAAAEASTLLGLFAKDQHDFQKRVLVVVLPSASTKDVPLQLSGLQRFKPKDLTVNALAPLLRLIHGLPEFVAPPVGAVPALTQQQFKVIDDQFGTPGEHAPVSGVPSDGQEVVQQQIASNPTGDAVRSLLTELAGWPGLEMRGRRPKTAPADSPDDFTSYLRLVVTGRTIGYLYPRSGLLNPKVDKAALAKALALAPAAHQVGSSNSSYQVSISIVDSQTAGQALELLGRPVGLR